MKPYNYKTDGITQSLLQAFLSCRQKADWYLQGWSVSRTSPALVYGTVIHGVIEYVYNGIIQKKITRPPSTMLIKKVCSRFEKQWRIENPNVTKDVFEIFQMSLALAETILPVYFEYWKDEDFKKIKWVALEQQFAIPFKTSDGRTTIIRGKKDGVYKNNKGLVSLFETKTKSMINMGNLIDTLWFEFQVNLYLWAIWKTYKVMPNNVTYNILRKTSLSKRVGESLVVYSNRVSEDIKKRPDFYFIRLDIHVSNSELRTFETQLNALIQDFMDWRDGKIITYKNTGACLDKYGACPYLNLCSKENFVPYHKRNAVFRELEDY